jgi:hypothetical protein
MKKILTLSLLFLMVLASGSFAVKYPLTTNTSQTLFDISGHPTNPNKVVATGKGPFLVYSTDGGKTGFAATWSKDATPTRIAHRSPDEVYVVGEAAGDQGRLYRSKDGGANFEDITAQLGVNILPLYDVNVSPDGVVAVGGKKLYIKSEKGDILESRVFIYKDAKWTRLSVFPASYDYYCVAVRGNTVVAVALEYFAGANYYDSHIYKFVIGEKDATLVATLSKVRMTDIKFLDDNTLIYSAYTGVAGKFENLSTTPTHTSLISGTTADLNAVAVYTPSGASSSSIPSAAALANGQTVLIAGDGGVMLKYDGTNTLKSVSSGTTAGLNGIVAFGPGYNYFAGTDGTAVLNLEPAPQNLFLTARPTIINSAPVTRTVSMTLTGNSLPPEFTLQGAILSKINSYSPERIDFDVTFPTAGTVILVFADSFGGTTPFAGGPVTVTPRPTIIRADTPMGEISRGPITLTLDGTGFSSDAIYPSTITPMRSGVVVPGISVDSLSVDSSTRITARLTIVDTVSPGPLTLRLTTSNLDTVDFDTTVSSDIYTSPLSKVWFDGKPYKIIYGGGDVISGGIGTEIKVKFTAANPMNASSIVPKVDGTPLTGSAIRAQSYDPGTGIYTTTLAEPLGTGLHTITIDAADDLGNASTTTCQVRVYDTVRLVEGTVPVVSPTPVTGNKFTVVYSLTRSAPSIDVLIASPAGRIVTKKTFNTPDANGVANGYSSGYNAVEIEVPSDLGKGIYPAKIVYGNQVVGKFYLVKQ